ncbi:MAG: glycosyltransferase family 4 protein [Acidobacteriaceae bacterium]
MKPIAINGRFLTQPVTGVQRHARELIFTLDAMLASGELQQPDQPVELLVPAILRESFPLQFFKLRKAGRSGGQLWEQLELPMFCRGKVLLTPCGGAPLLHRDHVFILPDAAVFATPRSYSRAYGAWYRWHHRRAARLPGLTLITVSEFSRGELARYLSIDPARIAVIPLGHEHALRPKPQPEILARLQLTPGQYLLAVGSANPNKNFGGLLQAFRILKQQHPETASHLQLVIAGRADTRIYGTDHLQQQGIIQTGYITDGELRALYESAACFVFPSLYEGFGLPLLEAMALGCPIAASNAASLPALGGEAAVYFNPHSPLEMAQAIIRIVADPMLRNALSDKETERYRQFCWRETARQTWPILMHSAQEPPAP